MYLQLQSQSLLIGKRPTGFTENYFTDWNDGLGKESISLFMVLSISSSQVPGDEIGREAFQLLQDHFLHDLSGDAYDRFENALREVNLMVTKKEKELDLKFVPNFHILIGVIQKDQLFLSQRGEAQGYLVRKRHLSLITDDLYDSKNTTDLFQNVASGQLEVGDTVILATGPLVQYVTPSDLSKIFSEQPLQIASKELKELLHQDIEEQMALLSFEVLERTEFSRAPQEESLEEGEQEEVVKEEAQHISRERLSQVKDSLGVFRKWLSHEDRFAFANRLKGLKTVDRKWLLGGIAGALLLLVLGIFFLKLDLGKKKALEEADQKLSTAEENLARAGTRGSFDKSEAAELLNEAEKAALEVLETGLLGSRASQLIDDIAEERETLDGVVHVDDELKLLVDFSDTLSTSGGEILGVLPLDDKNIVYTAKEVYEVLLDKASSPVVVEGDADVLAGAYFADRNNIVFLLGNGGLLEYEGSNLQFADTSDADWQKGETLNTYSSRVYVLDADEGQIWKYQRGSTAYGGAQAVVDTEKVDLKGAQSFAIDGSIWVLGKTGELMKLYSGDPVDFEIVNAPLTSLEGANKVWTSFDASSLYLLDPKNKRLLKFDKSTRNDDLTYSAQYVFDDLKGDLVDFYVDIERNTFLLVTDQALYELSFTE